MARETIVRMNQNFRTDPLELLKEIANAYQPRTQLEERRARERTLTGGDAWIHAWDGDLGPLTREKVECVDLSLSGIGFVTSTPLAEGQFVALEYQYAVSTPESQVHPLRMLARVCHAQRTDSGRWRLGCEFLSTMPEPVNSIETKARKGDPASGG